MQERSIPWPEASQQEEVVNVVLISLMTGWGGGEAGVVLRFVDSAFQGWVRWLQYLAGGRAEAARFPIGRPQMIATDGNLWENRGLWTWKCGYMLFRQAHAYLMESQRMMATTVLWGQIALMGCIRCGMVTGSWCDRCTRGHCTGCDGEHVACALCEHLEEE